MSSLATFCFISNVDLKNKINSHQKKINKKYISEAKLFINKKFFNSCYCGYLDVSKLLYCNFKINIHKDNDIAFRWAARNGHIEVLKYILSVDPEGTNIINAENDYAFRWAAENSHIEVLKWILSVDKVSL